MAKIVEPTAEQEAEWREWVASRPESVRKVAERFEPWCLYRLKTTGQRGQVHSFNENGTVTMQITGEFNFTPIDVDVFGLDPDDLEPCDLPGPDEVVGTMFTEDAAAEAYIDAIRPEVLAARGLPADYYSKKRKRDG